MKRYIFDTVLLTTVVAGAVSTCMSLDRIEHKVEVYRIENIQLKSEILELQKEIERTPIEILYRTKDTLTISKKERDCLIKNIYHEAGVEDHAGKIAVAQVTLNRVNNGRWGSDFCRVVYARSQFSWTRDRRKVSERPRGPLWEASIVAADSFLKGERVHKLERSTHYHTDYIKAPNWAKADLQVNKIGQHIFYAMN